MAQRTLILTVKKHVVALAIAAPMLAAVAWIVSPEGSAIDAAGDAVIVHAASLFGHGWHCHNGGTTCHSH